ncbi:hypothetical protein FE251_05465 [Georgenia wutianyii]|uniref:LLM class flavin-dependent oxidoreductase n=1 Tax=Georgenia wutianyii TaxID=2585135 RepID=A0ABX5VMG0_9MICO|nr:hypothetical protein [Georgenia wutianyii]QDB78881.1 hypothetical protein FE251_05465 [Georgenia wutianyii]
MSTAFLPTRTTETTSTTATIALDLSGLGAPAHDRGAAAGLPAEQANLVRLASYARAAHKGGVSFVTLGEDFRLRADASPRANAWLDPVIAARRISPSAGGTGLVPSVQLGRADAAVAAELAQFNRKSGSWAGLQVSRGRDERVSALPQLGDLLEDLIRTAEARSSQRPTVVLPLEQEAELPAVAELADVVRLREADLGWARELRFAVRSAARAAGRPPVRVLVDLRTVIAADYESARARADLLSDIAGGTGSWEGALEAVGTVGDVVTTIEKWLEAGAADGFVVLPGSIPADVTRLIRGIIPALQARGLVATSGAEVGRVRD